jgi:hypothetical protein
VTYPILKPAVVLVVWSLFMLLWMVATRLPALRAAAVDLRAAGGKGTDLDSVLPASIQWKAHNYNHLMEQPTLFYAVVLIVAVAAPADVVSYWLAWTYVVLRIAHSIWQATVNVVYYRARIFAAYSLVLIALSLRAAFIVFSL